MAQEIPSCSQRILFPGEKKWHLLACHQHSHFESASDAVSPKDFRNAFLWKPNASQANRAWNSGHKGRLSDGWPGQTNGRDTPEQQIPCEKELSRSETSSQSMVHALSWNFVKRLWFWMVCWTTLHSPQRALLHHGTCRWCDVLRWWKPTGMSSWKVWNRGTPSATPSATLSWKVLTPRSNSWKGRCDVFQVV